MLGRLIDAALPPRLGRSFRWLVASSWSTNLGDGLAISAGPLLVASQTDEPFVVALAAIAQQLPWVIFGLTAGVIADRYDRRRIMIIVNLVRSLVLGVLAVAIVLDEVNVAIVLLAMFLLGTTETFVDVTSGTLLPMTVGREDLVAGTVRLSFGHTTLNRLVGPPLGAFLFAAGTAWPFVAQGLLMLFGAVLIRRIAFSRASDERDEEHPGSIRSGIAEGLRWLWNDPPVRTLTVIILTFNITFGATLAVFVLYVERRLGLGPIGFGALEAIGAVGGLFGAVLYVRVEQRFGMARLMRIGLVFETATHVVFALTTLPIIAMATLFAFGVHEAVWGTTETTIRQRSVPEQLQGRIGSVYMLGLVGGLVVGAVIGGTLAQIWGVTAPYWFAVIGNLAILVAIWSRVDAIAATR